MIVSNSRKFVYLRVPRTGSTSLANFLIEHVDFCRETDFHTPVPYNRVAGLNMSAANRVHATLEDIVGYGILRHPIEDYAIFGIVRDPVDRFISSAWHACKHHGIQARDNDEAVAYGWRVADPQEPIFRLQADWLLHERQQINRIFAYEHLDLLAQAILGSRQAHVTFRHRSDSRKLRNTDLDESLRRKILDRYRQDQEIYESVIKSSPI